jgi:hypothetical protein
MAKRKMVVKDLPEEEEEKPANKEEGNVEDEKADTPKEESKAEKESSVKEESSDKDKTEETSDKDKTEETTDKDKKEEPSDKDKEEETSDKDKKEEISDKDQEKDKAKEGSSSEKKIEAEEPAATASPGPSTTASPGPTDRDVCVGDDRQKGTMLLNDLIRLHFILVKKDKSEVPTQEKDVELLAARLTQLMLHGKKYELSGLKDVPKPYLNGEGRFFEKKDDKWTKIDEEQAKAFVTKSILAHFKVIVEESDPCAEFQECVETLFKNSDPSTKGADEPSHHSAPRPCDVLFLPIEYPWEENMPYEHQSGNKHLLFLASQHVAADTNDSFKRVEAAFKLVSSKVEVNSGTELVQKTPRYVVQLLLDNQNSWKEMDRTDLAEFAAIFVFEVYLEKQIHGVGAPLSSQVANLLSETTKPGTSPVEPPTPHDVLFGRGGMTNGHVGNRRFRDIIALHRPDYIRATKMDKPNVARRIVRAIRHGVIPGRFLKKGDDNKWYDVGDRCAAEKTSQGLRERSNAEKRQRSALREALRIRREDLEEGPEGESAVKKQKIGDPSGMGQLGLSGIVPAYVGVGVQLNYAGGIPLSLSMKELPKVSKAKKSKKSKDEAGDGESNAESLPPNAVDKDGNILVTDHGKCMLPARPDVLDMLRLGFGFSH